MEWLLIWIGLLVVIISVARSKGRPVFEWFMYGVFLAPIALIHVLVVQPTEKGRARRADQAGRAACPFCAEFVKREALVCPHCRKDLPAGWAGPRPSEMGEYGPPPVEPEPEPHPHLSRAEGEPLEDVIQRAKRIRPSAE